jgi:hypothetical protein
MTPRLAQRLVARLPLPTSQRCALQSLAVPLLRRISRLAWTPYSPALEEALELEITDSPVLLSCGHSLDGAVGGPYFACGLIAVLLYSTRWSRRNLPSNQIKEGSIFRTIYCITIERTSAVESTFFLSEVWLPTNDVAQTNPGKTLIFERIANHTRRSSDFSRARCVNSFSEEPVDYVTNPLTAKQDREPFFQGDRIIIALAAAGLRKNFGGSAKSQSVVKFTRCDATKNKYVVNRSLT